MYNARSVTDRDGIYFIKLRHDDKEYPFAFLQGPQNHFSNLLTGFDYYNTPFPMAEETDYDLYWDEYPSDEKDTPIMDGRSIIKIMNHKNYEPSWNVGRSIEAVHNIKRIQNLSIFMYDTMKMELNFTPRWTAYAQDNVVPPEINLPSEDFSLMELIKFGDDLMIYPIARTICGDALVIAFSTYLKLTDSTLKWNINAVYNNDYTISIGSDHSYGYNLIDCCYYIPQIFELLNVMRIPSSDRIMEIEVTLSDMLGNSIEIRFDSSMQLSNYTLSTENLPYFNMYDRIAYVINQYDKRMM